MSTINYIPINKDLIPYQLQMTLNEKTYTFGIRYNSVKDFFTIDLYLGDTALVIGEKINYGRPLFETHAEDNDGNRDERFPSDIIIALDLSSEATKVTYDNFQDSVFLYTFARSDIIG